MVEFTLNYILNGLPSFKIANSPTASAPSPPAPMKSTIQKKRTANKTPKPQTAAPKTRPKNRSRKSLNQTDEFKKRLLNASNNPRYCAYCKNHGIYSLTLGHRNRCEYRNCVCLKCLSVRERYSVNANVVRKKRAKEIDDFRAKYPQYFQPTRIRKKDSSPFDSIFQGDTDCSQSAYRSLWNMILTLLARFELSMDSYPILYLILKEVSSDVEILCQKIFQCKNEVRIVMEKIMEQGKGGKDAVPQLCLPSNESSSPLPKKRHISSRALIQGPAGNVAEEMNVVPPTGGASCNSFVGEPLILGYDTPPLSVSSPDNIPLADGRERASSNPSITDDYQVDDGEGSLHHTFLNQTGSRMTAVFVEVTSIPGDEVSGHSPLMTQAGPQRIGSYTEQVSPVSVKGRGQHKYSMRGGSRRIDDYSEAENQRDFIAYHGQGALIPFQSYPLFVHEVPSVQ